MPTAQGTMDNSARRHYRHIEVRPIAGALEAEIGGVDSARPLESKVVSEIRQAFLDHLVIKLEHERVNSCIALRWRATRRTERFSYS